ncbi:unnamed protein product [Paramecium sonneborni]|uniref:Uncharacterized protein n=1 Tax=Paramecium sonneborni TaxID=65129 RepID=A0A8S1RPY9_9CILI|nr:unnamed protein product [Paramecium sonneborni]
MIPSVYPLNNQTQYLAQSHPTKYLQSPLQSPSVILRCQKRGYILQYQDVLKIKFLISAQRVIGYVNYIFDQIFDLNDFFLSTILQDYQDCLDQNKDPFDGCFSGKYDCIQGCSNCIRGICIECKEGWEYNILLETCFPICGDKLIIYDEECDDENQQEYYGCFNCKFSCLFGKCLECLSNYNLIDQRCEEINGSQDYQSQDQFSIQISNFQDYGNYYHKLLHDQFANPLPIHNVDCDLQTHHIFGYFYHQCKVSLIENCLRGIFDQCLECKTFIRILGVRKNVFQYVMME